MKKIIGILLLTHAALLHCDDDDFNQPLRGKSFLAPRSQSVNAARELTLWHRFINQYCQDFYGAFSVTPEYSHSFRRERMAEYYFGLDNLVITGSTVTNRDNRIQILADYFGLAQNFQSTVRMEPEIRTGLIDLDIYLGYQDFYFRMHVPYVWTKWAFELHETIAPQTIPLAPYAPLYMDTGAVVAPATSFTQAIAGGLTWGQVSQPLQFGRIAGAQSAHGFAEAQLALGWNFINCPNGHAGLNIRGSIPAGTRSKAIYLFEPVVGNGHHPELGMGFTGHLLLWERDGEQTINIFSDVNITHLFNSRQIRSFDLINPADPNNDFFLGFGTRYVLAKEFDDAGNYTGVTLPTINVTTLACDVSMAIQVDAVIMASYEYCGYVADLGYNVWLRSREEISNRQPIPHNRYALKGIQNVAGININATQSTATVTGNNFADQALVADPNPPVFFNDDQIDERSAQASRGFTHKVFGSFGYTWDDECSCFAGNPFLGIGGEVEFEGLNPRHEIKANKNTISQWGIWIKGGFGF